MLGLSLIPFYRIGSWPRLTRYGIGNREQRRVAAPVVPLDSAPFGYAEGRRGRPLRPTAVRKIDPQTASGMVETMP